MSIRSINNFSLDFFSLQGKTAIVTGGNSGLGQAFSVALAKAGANVFIPAITSDGGETEEAIKQQGVDVEFMEVDITAEGAPQKIISACCERFGTVDILVNNAGICKMNNVWQFNRADWDPMINVNLTAAFELCHEAAKVMAKNLRGKIINICSVRSFLGQQGSPAYSATKHALAGLTKAYCDELAQFNIQVNGIAPGYFSTDITQIIRKDRKQYKWGIDHTPAMRWGDTQDLMGAVIFLASRASDFVNGHLLVVDGGYLVR